MSKESNERRNLNISPQPNDEEDRKKKGQVVLDLIVNKMNGMNKPTTLSTLIGTKKFEERNVFQLSIQQIKDKKSVIEIGDYAFEGCEELTELPVKPAPPLLPPTDSNSLLLASAFSAPLMFQP